VALYGQITDEVVTVSAPEAAELAETIAAAVGFEGEIVWDDSRPDGQMERGLDASKAREMVGFEAEVELEDGIDRTVGWFRKHAAAGG